MEKPFIRVGLGGCHQTDRPRPRKVPSQMGKRHSILAKISAIPCVMAFFMLSSWNQVEGQKSWPCRLSPMISSNREFFMRAFKGRAPWRKPAPFLEPRWGRASIFSYQLAAKTTACFAPQLLVFLKLSIRNRLGFSCILYSSNKKWGTENENLS